VAGPSAQQDYSARCASPQWGRPYGRSALLRAAVRSGAERPKGSTDEEHSVAVAYDRMCRREELVWLTMRAQTLFAGKTFV
jgi:hypothetical protein